LKVYIPAGDHAELLRTLHLYLRRAIPPAKLSLQNNPSQIEEKTILAIFFAFRGVPLRPIPRKGSDSTTTIAHLFASHKKLTLPENH